MPTSAGLLLYRVQAGELQVLLVHPGGPFFKNKDAGSWTIPKGEVHDAEEPLAAAQREFAEETGFQPQGPFLPLLAIKQKSGKRVQAWAVAGELDPAQLVSNTFLLEWPPKSGKHVEFPEVDRAGWFHLAEAREKMNAAQVPWLDELTTKLTTATWWEFHMQRRTFLHTAAISALAARLSLAVEDNRWTAAEDILARAIESKELEAAALHVVRRGAGHTRGFGPGISANAMFLLGSISKPINIAAVMTLYDQGEFKLDDRVKKYLPKFTGEGRDEVTIRHLMTHVSGLPDQLADNADLRKQQAPLAEFAEQTFRTPLSFAPGTKYQYSSMGILLATRIAELLSGQAITKFVEQVIFKPLGMKHSAQGLGRFALADMVPCQMEGAAPESGGGDPSSKDWNWNSPYWRQLGAPWGGTHCSAADVGRFLAEFLEVRGAALKPETVRLMLTNHNPAGFTARGLGFHLGKEAGSPGCSEQTFGHTGSTGTLCWADPATKTICVVLTSLPRRGATRHPREVAAEKVAAAME